MRLLGEVKKASAATRKFANSEVSVEPRLAGAFYRLSYVVNLCISFIIVVSALFFVSYIKHFALLVIVPLLIGVMIEKVQSIVFFEKIIKDFTSSNKSSHVTGAYVNKLNSTFEIVQKTMVVASSVVLFVVASIKFSNLFFGSTNYFEVKPSFKSLFSSLFAMGFIYGLLRLIYFIDGKLMVTINPDLHDIKSSNIIHFYLRRTIASLVILFCIQAVIRSVTLDYMITILALAFFVVNFSFGFSGEILNLTRKFQGNAFVRKSELNDILLKKGITDIVVTSVSWHNDAASPFCKISLEADREAFIEVKKIKEFSDFIKTILHKKGRDVRVFLEFV